MSEKNTFMDSYRSEINTDLLQEDAPGLLFKHFCNCLYLGQWQLARAFTPMLRQNARDKPISEIIKDISCHPFNRSVLSPALSSPCQLSWLALLQYEHLTKAENEEESVRDSAGPDRNLTQFHLLLLEVCPHITDNELKELYLYHRWTHSTVSTTHPLNLSSILLRFLQTLLSRQPQLGHELICCIYNSKKAHNEKNNKALLSVYVNAINLLLDDFHINDLDPEVKSTSADKVYEIFSYFGHDDDLLCHLPTRLMFCKILEHCKAEAAYLDKVKVTSVLMGHSNKYLLTEFCRLDYELETNNAVAMYQVCAELTEEQRWLLHLSTLSETSIRWKLFFLLSMKKKRHLLEVVMETGLALIKCSMFKELQRLIEPVELHPLKPLLLLLGWTHCCSTSEARQLLKILWNNQTDVTHPAIAIGCNKLAYQIDLIQWCLEKARPLMTEETPAPQFQRATDLYKGLESHSVLYVLHNSTRLSALDQEEVLDLLQKVPFQGQNSEDGEKKQKTVRFKEDSDSGKMATVTSLDQKKDMAIYSGYCVIKNVMDAILFCAKSSDSRLTCPIRQKSRRRISNKLYSESGSESGNRSRSDSNLTNCDTPVCDANNVFQTDELTLQNIYNINVTARLTQVQTFLSKMQPLTFRLEVIEDVFSLLFLTHEDIQEMFNLSEYDTDEQDDKSHRTGSTCYDSPQSPTKDYSSESRDVGQSHKQKAISTDQNGSGLDYDVPFEDIQKRNNLHKLVDMNKVGEKLETVKQTIAEKMSRDLQNERFHSSHSENISSMSASSSINLLQLGFVVNEYLVRDILTVLKECLVDLSSMKYHLHGNKSDTRERHRPHKVSDSCLAHVDLASEEALCRLVRSSISTETLQKRLTQMEKFVSEAQWRFQIVCNKHIPKAAGQILSDVISDSDNSDEEIEIRSLNINSRASKRHRSSLRLSKSERDRGDNHHSDSSMGGDLHNRQMSRSLSRSHSISRSLSRSQSIISLMLSAPVTLLIMSVRRGQHTQTKQIIKLFKFLEKEPETVEVYFSQAFQKASRSVQSLTGNSTPQSPDGAKPSLKSVANMAAAGVATATISSIVDELLEFPTLPQILNLPSNENIPQIIHSVFQGSSVQLMCLLDLLCCYARYWDVCNHISDAIHTHSSDILEKNTSSNLVGDAQETSKSASSKQRVNRIKRFSEFFHQVESLIQLGAEAEFPLLQEHAVLTKTFHKSVQYFFCQAVFSLLPDKCKQYANFCMTMSKNIHSVQEAFSQSRSRSKDSLTDSLHKQGLSESVRSRSDSKQDKPTIHHSMKQLIHQLEKDVPVGGIKSIIARPKVNSFVPNRNYLLSLYEHCKELAYLVAESEAVSKEEMVVPKNFFDTLHEGPLKILGRMMFTKKMPPAKLEKVAAKLSLNLTHIIVYSCCLKIPSKRVPLLHVSNQEPETETVIGKVIHNCRKRSSSDITTSPEPVQFLQNILLQLVSLMKDLASRFNADNLFDIACATQLGNSTYFYVILSELSTLQWISLSGLDNDQRKCFFGNLQTIMTIHCHINHIRMLIYQGDEDSHYTRRTHRVIHYEEMTSREQISMLNTFCYRVGDVGVISLFDLKYQINRCGLFAPSEWGKCLEYRLYPLNPDDPWYLAAPRSDPLLLFAVTTCGISSPPIQILSPENLNKQLDTCMMNFLQTTVHIDKQHKLIKIPETLLWHRRDFISDQFRIDGVSENEGLIAFIASHLTGEKEKLINEVMALEREIKKRDSSNDLPYDIEVIPSCKTFMCVFDFESIPRAELYHNSSNQLPGKEGSGDKAFYDGDITYDLTPNTLEYIKSDCPLVATLVSLVCSDDVDETNMDDAFDETYFNVSGSHGSHDSNYDLTNRERAASSMSVVDMKSYRYEKLTYDYPTFKRHLLNFIVPLAATEDHDILKGDDPILKLLTSEIMEKIKTNMLSLHESVEFQNCLTGLLNELFSHRKWTEIVQVIDSIPVTVLTHNTSLCSLRDFVIICVIHAICSTGDTTNTLPKEKSEKVCTLLHEVVCIETRARELMAVHERLEIEHNMDLFDMCLSNSDLSDSVRKAVKAKFKRIKVYYRITECAKNLQIKLSLQSSDLITEEDKMAAKKRHFILDKFTQWKTVVEWTRTAPREVLALLIKTGDFETALSWCQLEQLGNDIKREIDEKYFVSLLSCQPQDTTKAFMILEKLKKEDAESCSAICQKFVAEFNQQDHVMFVTDYLLNHLSSFISEEEKDQVRLTHIGSRMILSLPTSMHQEYSHLVSMPRFILEQLIMNMKPELAGKAYSLVQDEFQLVKGLEQQFTTDQFNTLVSLYAKRALEFTVIQQLESGDKERTFSIKSVSSTDRLDMVQTRDSPLMRHSPQPRQFLDSMTQKRRSVDIQSSTRLIQSAPTGSGSPAHKIASPSKEKFVMPAEPPPRDQWVPDSSASVCMVCNVERFSMFNRRHHCRRCGRVVCSTCSSKVTPIKGINARTCDDCYREIVKSSDQPQTGEPNIYPSHQRLSGSSMTGIQSMSVTESFISTIQEERALSLSDVINHSHTVWKLQLDHVYNANLKEDFFFEQAPSTSLCISILNLHDNPKQCGQLILNMCDDLSQFLKPIAPGVPNPEVDYNLIMSMMKYLLFHAKIKFTKCGDNGGMGKCDMYQGLVDLLGLLVTDNYRDLPSIQELTKMDSVRRLRDKLIENERLSLAMEVSTKCGLDPTGVWVAWGMMCLQGGNFVGAREKYSKCLKQPKDKNVCTPLTKVLTDIIDCLETMPGTGAMEVQLSGNNPLRNLDKHLESIKECIFKIQVLLANLGSIKSLITTPSSTFFEEASMDSEQFQESLFYLRTYGNYLAVVDFYRRHGYYMKAVQYILDHRCSSEVFIEGLLRPSLEMGELCKLTDQMLMIDPSLERWNNYMTAACRYLVRNRHHHVLYEFQLFMKDYIRAGISCFSYFYEEGAQSYFDLSRRIQYLFTAQQHMQAYLDPTHWGNVQHPLSLLEKQGSWESERTKNEQGAVRLVKTTEEVKKYIKTIALQIEVTKFLHSCLTSGKGEAASFATKFVNSSKQVPTLFSSTQIRNELTIMILLSGDDVETAFTLATRIIKEYKLGAIGIYTHVAREMAKTHRYDNMRQLLQCVESSGMGSDDTMDEILGACLLVVADDKNEAKEAENIIKLLRKDANKINAYILCGKLRSAYLMAVKENRVDDVKRILRAAKSMGQNAVITICNKWLEQHVQRK